MSWPDVINNAVEVFGAVAIIGIIYYFMSRVE